MGYTSGMNPQEPVIPDPDPAPNAPSGPVGDPSNPDQPAEYNASAAGEPADSDERREGLDPYDQAVDDSFPASDPPAASEPGAP
ncbi:MAG: hypothetical protein JWM87_901 [Candidatus Eremiobacteraeota bacterium]|nr:hypothetical protein [Candidatus Eremiobacteraeota bacterium]